MFGLNIIKNPQRSLKNFTSDYFVYEKRKLKVYLIVKSIYQNKGYSLFYSVCYRTIPSDKDNYVSPYRFKLLMTHNSNTHFSHIRDGSTREHIYENCKTL